MSRVASDPSLRARLLELQRRDDAKRQELVERGELFEGYHPEMEAVHAANARALERELDAHGWPDPRRTGEDGARAACRVAIHAIGEPAFQRRCLALLEAAVADGRAAPAHLATLTDRVRFNERRPQRYGTLLDWDAEGRLSPWPIEDPGEVAGRRRAVGLPPLAQSVREARERAEREGARPPRPFAERQAEIDAWARRTGWLDG